MKKFGKKINLDRDLLESPFSLVGDPERDFESLLDWGLEIKYLNFSSVLFTFLASRSLLSPLLGDLLPLDLERDLDLDKEDMRIIIIRTGDTGYLINDAWSKYYSGSRWYSLGLGPRLGPLAATARPGLGFWSLLTAAAAGPVCGKMCTLWNVHLYTTQHFDQNVSHCQSKSKLNQD